MGGTQKDWTARQVKVPPELDADVDRFIAEIQHGEGSFSSVARDALRFYLSARRTDGQADMFRVLEGAGSRAD